MSGSTAAVFKEQLHAHGDATTQVVAATGTGAAFGALVGLVKAAWQQPGPATPTTLASSAKSSIRVVGGNTVAFAAIAGAYQGASLAAETVRGKKDAANGVVGAIAAGAVVGLRTGLLGRAIGAAAVLSAVSVAMNVNEGFFSAPAESMRRRGGSAV